MTDTENTQTVWNFYPVKPIAGIRHIPLEEDTEFSPKTFTFQFRGYKTGYGLNATLWGKKSACRWPLSQPESHGKSCRA